jgi:hypothetical protein
MNCGIIERPRIRRLDVILFGALVLFLFPAFHAAHLPFRIDVKAFAGAYWGGTAVRAIFAAVLVAVAGLPLETTLLPALRRYREQKLRFFFVGVLCIWMFWLFGYWFGLTIVADAVAIAELFERKKEQFVASLTDIFLPSAYLFVGVVLVYLLNHAIAGIRYAGSDDAAFEKLDLLLFRINVFSLAQAMVRHLPPLFFRVMELVYFSLFGQIGGAIVITALLTGRQYAIRYVRTLLTAYLVALVCFFFWPTIGPFSIYSPQERSYLRALPTYSTQEAILLKADLLHEHKLIPEVANVNLIDYYIGFPSMHVAMPLIAVWFLRKWRNIALILIAFDVLLLVSIVALQWHYLSDLAGGVLVAGLAIAINREFGSSTSLATESGDEPATI